jgi:transcriptional regulator GlxA family with amidase domain
MGILTILMIIASMLKTGTLIIVKSNRVLFPVNCLWPAIERHQPVRRKSIRKRDIALLTAKNYIDESNLGALTVPELCKVAAVSERTLEYAFRERYGLTPKNYLQLHRLNKVRKQLRMADPENCQVTEIARQHDFWHMGAFGADYKKLFAEFPFETLMLR